MADIPKFEAIVRRILRDIRVELSEEFDRNFERQAFFSEAWQRRRSPGTRNRATLVNTGTLRRSLRSEVRGTAIEFSSDITYAGIHNEGGEIVVTARMKKYFWARHIKAKGGLGRKKDGSLRKDRRNLRLSAEAEFWKRLALMKEGGTVKIPRRQFLGTAPELEHLVEEIIDENLDAFFKKYELD